MCSPRSLVPFADALVATIGRADPIRDIISGHTVNPMKLDPRNGSCQSHPIASIRAGGKIYNQNILELNEY